MTRVRLLVAVVGRVGVAKQGATTPPTSAAASGARRTRTAATYTRGIKAATTGVGLTVGGALHPRVSVSKIAAVLQVAVTDLLPHPTPRTVGVAPPTGAVRQVLEATP